jgi:tRNA pseudouridine55 synthase
VARKRRGRAINGWLIIDKPAGMTSARVVGKVRHLLDAAKAGHAGSLDPLATGVLPIALGEATKTVSYVMDGAKAYRFTVRWGESRDTDDADGAVTGTSDERPDEAEIRAALAAFQGEIIQVPPVYSAIKVDGKRAYALARADEAPELEARTVRIDRFELADLPDPDHASFLVECGKGTYMRGLARDLAASLGTLGHVTQLRRVAVGPFMEKHAISLENLAALGHSAAQSDCLHPVETALDDIPALAMTESEAGRLRRGQPVPVLRTANRERIRDLADGCVLCALTDGRLVAFTRLEGNQVFPVRVLNT